MAHDSFPCLRWVLRCALPAGLVFGVLLFASVGTLTPRSLATIPVSGLAPFPKTILWAWERPEHLKFIDPSFTGVAFLARTLNLRGDEVFIQPRLQPLEIPPATSLIAVVRIETDPKKRPSLSHQQTDATISAINEVSTLKNVRAVQIDFDALSSEREYYRRVLIALRRTLPANLPISITALASWCMHDHWLANLPIDEAVPMLFRMGVGQRQVNSYLSTHSAFKPEICRQSVGASVDEPLPRMPARQRTYVFNPQPWNIQSVEYALKEAGK